MTDANMYLFNTFLKDLYDITYNINDKILFKEVYTHFRQWVQFRCTNNEFAKYKRKTIYTALKELRECPYEHCRDGLRLLYIINKQAIISKHVMVIPSEELPLLTPIVDDRNQWQLETLVTVGETTNDNKEQEQEQEQVIVTPKVILKLVVQLKPQKEQITNTITQTHRQSHQIFTGVPPLKAPFQTAASNTRPPLVVPTLNNNNNNNNRPVK